jgi:ketosteroid isomerase-like protein
LHSGWKVATLGLALATLCGGAVMVRGRLSRGGAAASPLDTGLTDVLGPKIEQEWAAFKNKDEKAYGELLTDDYLGVEVDGEGTRNKEQAIREIRKSAVTDCGLSRLATRRLAEDVAMATYEAFLQFTPSAGSRYLRIYVTEIWVRRDSEWKALHYQETRVR